MDTVGVSTRLSKPISVRLPADLRDRAATLARTTRRSQGDVVRWLREADPQTARRIRDGFLAVVATGNLRIRGKALTGRLSGLCRYRIGDYRAICDIQDTRLIVLVLEAGERDHIYD